MVDLARTVQIGTGQLARGKAELRAATADKRRRKLAGLSAAGDAFAGLGSALKDHGDMRQAAEAERELAEINQAYGLGLAAKGPAGAKATLSGLTPRTAKGAQLLATRSAEVQGLVNDQDLAKLRAAQGARYDRQNKEWEAEQEEKKREHDALTKIFSKPLPPDASDEHKEIRRMVAAGLMRPQDYQRWLATNLQEAGRTTRAQEGIESKEGIAKAGRESREDIAVKGLASKFQIALAKIASREGIEAAELEQAQKLLDFKKGAAQSAEDLKYHRLRLDKAMGELRLVGYHSHEQRLNLANLLDMSNKAHLLAEAYLAAGMYENDEQEQELKDEIRRTKTEADRYRGRLEMMMESDPPDLGIDLPNQGQAPGGSPTDLTPDEQAVYDSLDDGGKAEFLKALGE